MDKLKCRHIGNAGEPCGNEWIPRTDSPQQCPLCKCRKWNKPHA